MMKLDNDQQEYVHVWTAILRHVLLYSEEQMESWLRDYGFPLLLANNTFVFHEEPWFWLCSTIASSFARDPTVIDLRVYENKVFWLLDKAIRGKPLDEVDWATVRSECARIFEA